MKTTLTLSLAMLLTAGACDRAETVGTARTTGASVAATEINTRVNGRDRAGQTVTPITQGNGSEDLETTQAIRQSVMSDDSLSFLAKNVKVITSNGTITLRGPVRSQEERATIETKAVANAGGNRVDDQLDIVPKN